MQDDLTIINRRGQVGAGVLNDALAMAIGDYICVYDADAMPEKNALYFQKEVPKDPERHVASFGRNKRGMPIKTSDPLYQPRDCCHSTVHHGHVFL